MNFTDVALQTLEASIFDRTLAAIDEQFAQRPLVQARLLQTMATTLRGLGLYDTATAPQVEALKIRRHVLGDGRSDTIDSLVALGLLLQRQDRHAEAEPHLREAVDAAMRELGGRHRTTIWAINALGVLLHGVGAYAESERRFREALGFARDVLDEDDRLAMALCGNLGFALERQEGRRAEAERLYEQTLRHRRRVLGNDHVDTLWSLLRMGVVLREQGRLVDAEPYLREAVDGYRRVQGEAHWRTHWAIYHRGVLLRELGVLDEAASLATEAVELSRRAVPPAHGDTALFLVSQGQALTALERFGEAEATLLEARALFERSGVSVAPAAGDFSAALAEAFVNLYEAWDSAEPGDAERPR